MSEDIKEILDKFRKLEYDDYELEYDIDQIERKEEKLLLDYITNLQEENEELKMTNLALADDITKNKIIKQEVLTECCGIPIGEIPMLTIKNDEYKQRIDKAIEYINKHFHWGIDGNDNIDDLLNILQGKSDE